MKDTFKTYLFILTLIVFSLLVSFAQSGIDYFFEQGNQAYRDGKYQEAIGHYQKILDAGYESGRLYYNLGNCYYKLDKIGYAVLYYEKSKRFLPNDPEVEFNLELAELKVIDRIDLPPRFFLFEWWDKAIHFYSIPQLTKLLLIFYLLTAVVFVFFLFLKNYRVRRLLLSFFIVSLVLTVFCGYVLFTNVHEEKTDQQAVIVSPSVTILSAPDENSTDVFVLHEGIKVKLRDQREDWLRIELPDGKSGWLKKDHLGII